MIIIYIIYIFIIIIIFTENNMVTVVTNPQVNLLNCLEQMGYRVVTSGAFVATQMVTKW